MKDTNISYHSILFPLIVFMFIALSDQMFAQGGIWSTKSPMPTARGYLAVGVVNNILYAVGGADSTWSHTFATVEAYDPVSNTWMTKAPMPTARHSHGIGVVNNVLYAIGGIDTNTQISSIVEAYNPATNTWTRKSPMPTQRISFAVGVVNGVIYTVGGQNIYNITVSTVEAYNPLSDTWSTKTPMPTARVNLAVGVVNGILYAVGGTKRAGGDVTDTVEAYDPVRGTWTAMASMPTARNLPSVGVMDEILYAVGGQGTIMGSYAEIDAFDPDNNIWTTKNPMPTTRMNFAVGVVDDTLYVVGGLDAQSLTSMNSNEAFTLPRSTNIYLSSSSLNKEYVLLQNYPNPFNPSTIINYQTASAGKVNLVVYDLLGREIKTLVNEVKVQGSYTATFNAANIPSGVYFYRIRAGNFNSVKKLILLK